MTAPRVIVVGSGIAGLTAALRASAFADVTVLTKGALQESNTLYAQGGIAAALFDDDSVDDHISDTLAAGAGLGDDNAVRILCSEGPDLVRELVDFGVAFDRHGRELARGLEAAHSRARILHAGGDATGRAIEVTLAGRVGRAGIRVIEHTMLTDLVLDDGRAVGVEMLDQHGARHVIAADAVVLATGGAGRLYSHTTNPAVATGDGVAAAWRAGAELADLEFYQFHPTALAVGARTLVSEAVRGEGAVLLDQNGERFMTAVHPDAELAPRDIVARAIAARMAAQGGLLVLLDATHLGAEFLARRFPTIDAACRAAGLDWGRSPIPVTPAAHYWMGGVATDLHGRTSVPGLYAVGEAACTGAQGANRLASNSLLEGLVFGARAVDAIALDSPARSAYAEEGREAPVPVPVPVPDHEPGGMRHTDQPAAHDRRRAGSLSDIAVGDDVRDIMWRHVGVERTAQGLADTIERLDALAVSVGRPASIQQQENVNLVTLGALIARCALEREESRGAHFRADFPLPASDPEHTVVTPDALLGDATIARRRGLRYAYANNRFLNREAVAAC